MTWYMEVLSLVMHQPHLLLPKLFNDRVAVSWLQTLPLLLLWFPVPLSTHSIIKKLYIITYITYNATCCPINKTNLKQILFRLGLQCFRVELLNNKFHNKENSEIYIVTTETAGLKHEVRTHRYSTRAFSTSISDGF